jgi:glycosyltransferase involved in cell wall biosynthesis
MAALVIHAHPAVAAAARHGARMLIRQIAGWFAAVLTRKPSVTVVTPTWERRSLLTRRCIPSVRGQTYRGPVSHVIVSDGPDEGLAGVDGVKFLPAHVLEQNRGLTARRHGAELADGELIAYLDDDNAWRPDHLERLVSALVRSGADFAYSRALCHDSGRTWTIGQSAPVFGQIDTSVIVHRRELLGLSTWEASTGPADWSLVSRWVAAGATWAHVPHVTMDYYHPAGADHAAV